MRPVGRKKIYQYDMLFYAFGMLFLIFASAPWMIIVGFLLVGLAVGADIPASWSLIAEQAPDTKRGAHSGVAQVLWYLGPVVVLGAAYFLKPFGIDGVRWLFVASRRAGAGADLPAFAHAGIAALGGKPGSAATGKGDRLAPNCSARATSNRCSI